MYIYIQVGDKLIKNKYIVRVIPQSERVEPAVPEYAAPKKNSVAGKRKAALETEERESKVRKLDNSCVIAGGKDEQEGMVESIANHGALWHVNPPAFTWDFRAIAIERVMTDRFGASTASLMKLLLNTVRSKALQPNHLNSNTVPAASVDAILAAHRQQPEDIGMQVTWESLSDHLDTLCQDAFKCVTKLLTGGAGGASYKPDLCRMLTYAFEC